MQIKVAPSILSADFSKLSSEIRTVSVMSDLLHIDVMDGHFVPNISIGVPVVASLASATKLPLDIHLMIDSPEKFITAFADALASGVFADKTFRDISQDYIVVHAESCGGSGGIPGTEGSVEALVEVLKMIKARGIKAGFSVKPATPIENYEVVLPFVDMVLIMTVEPGFGGQKFMDYMMPKVRWLRAKIDESNGVAAGGASGGGGISSGGVVVGGVRAGALNFGIEVDGGINDETCKTAVSAGADVLVAGNYIFKAKNRKKAIEKLRV